VLTAAQKYIKFEQSDWSENCSASLNHRSGVTMVILNQIIVFIKCVSMVVTLPSVGDLLPCN
jgi:hypothetical protein